MGQDQWADGENQWLCLNNDAQVVLLALIGVPLLRLFVSNLIVGIGALLGYRCRNRGGPACTRIDCGWPWPQYATCLEA
ncbi:hypothetical protein DWQ67_05415 [Galactobacter caseinivorans]|uniref:Uncharacterized protein n=1 Tax=Galactobacter caseinivorans TaxID=2676123 RepID=A0A496PL29_9MICC|nr:hypothetical protein DWQ67_05415 [Galactobacter caseinivorans]